MNRDTLLATLIADGKMAEAYGPFFVRVRFGTIWHTIDARHVTAQPPLVSALWSQQRGEGPAITKPAQTRDVAASDYEPEPPQRLLDALGDPDDTQPISAAEGSSAAPEGPAVDMGKADDELEVPGFLSKHQVTGAVRAHTTSEGW
jgi:hypothetical protein